MGREKPCWPLAVRAWPDGLAVPAAEDVTPGGADPILVAPAPWPTHPGFDLIGDGATLPDDVVRLEGDAGRQALERARVAKRLSAAQLYETFDEVVEQVEDDSESAGLGHPGRRQPPPIPCCFSAQRTPERNTLTNCPSCGWLQKACTIASFFNSGTCAGSLLASFASAVFARSAHS